VERGAQEWGLGARGALLVLSLPALVVALGAGAALLGKGAFKALTGEDGIAETLQVLCYALALAGSLVLARRLRTRGRGGLGGLYLLLAAGLFFLIGEELSWGQRLAGWSTPEALEAVNKQGETNLHNIEGVGAAFKWIQCLVGAYGLFLPLTLRVRALARFRSWLAYLIPPASLAPYFGAMFVWRLYRNLFEPPDRFYFVVSEFNEVLELVLAFGFALFVLHGLRRTPGPGAARRAEWLRRLAGPARADGPATR
jgi:hypothetical protein